MPVQRPAYLAALERLLAENPVVALLGARQVGKTTLARDLAAQGGGPVTHFDLEDSRDLARLEDPMLTLEPLKGLVVLDEVQRRPDLFPTLRVLADRPGQPARFLVLGSASPELLRQGSETLAGRLAFQDLEGFDLEEVGVERLDELWLRGGFPRSFLAANDAASDRWRRDFLRTVLERELPQLGSRVSSLVLERFWTMLSHYHGQIWSGAELARALGVSQPTVARYRDLLQGARMLRVLPPWTENIGKRTVRSPKVYVADSGLLHRLLGLASRHDLEGHPKVGASWEGFLLQQVIRVLRAWPEECFFWATHAGAELDLLVVHGGNRYGFEFKRSSAPKLTRSMRSAFETLGLQRLDVIHAGDETFPLAEGFRAVAVRRLLEDIEPLR